MSEGLDFASPADAAAFAAARVNMDAETKKGRTEKRPTTAKHEKLLTAANERAADYRDKFRIALLGNPFFLLIGFLIGWHLKH